MLCGMEAQKHLDPNFSKAFLDFYLAVDQKFQF